MKQYRWAAGIFVLSLTIAAGGIVMAQPGDCDGTTGSDTINCTTTPGTPDNQADGDLGDDTITIGTGVTVTYVDADGAATGGDVEGAGPGGNDTIVNNGTVTVSIAGDFSTGNPGDDHITNNGTVGDILGDETNNTTAPNGDDTIINNATVTGYIEGDGNDDSMLGGGAGGNDTIINNGSVGTDIRGDSGSGPGGNDTITNNGSVGNNIEGDGGNDTVTLGDTSSVGNDILMGDGNDKVTVGDGALVGNVIDGGDGTDTLEFKFNDPDEGAAAAAILAGLSPAGGTVTFGGITYTWTNFEQLVAIFTTIGGGGGGGGGTGGGSIIVTLNSVGGIQDGRLNAFDLAAPLVVYCKVGEQISIIDVQADGSYPTAFVVDFDAVNNAVAAAKASLDTVTIDTGLGDVLVATKDGALVAFGPTLDGSKIYSFTFQPGCTASALGLES
ncbi:MAG: hypothetical protein LCI00_32470 [Chloroflexi bacterium]|nr:hypothetical protein [Chloroflexota bacterium]MCC6894655.1 hypothetical protein [Anaerolineae bacterium]